MAFSCYSIIVLILAVSFDVSDYIFVSNALYFAIGENYSMEFLMNLRGLIELFIFFLDLNLEMI